MAKVIAVPDDEFARQKAELAARCVQARVVGSQPIRDAITRESVSIGIVNLDPTTTMIAHLVTAGAIELVTAAPVVAIPEG